MWSFKKEKRRVTLTSYNFHISSTILDETWIDSMCDSSQCDHSSLIGHLHLSGTPKRLLEIIWSFYKVQFWTL